MSGNVVEDDLRPNLLGDIDPAGWLVGAAAAFRERGLVMPLRRLQLVRHRWLGLLVLHLLGIVSGDDDQEGMV